MGGRQDGGGGEENVGGSSDRAAEGGGEREEPGGGNAESGVTVRARRGPVRGRGGGGRRRMAEPRRVPFISLSPVRRREAESPALERESGGREPEPPPAGREVPLLEPPPPPRESAARLEPPREPGRPEPPPQREPPRPEPPPPPRQGSRQEPPPPQEALPLRQTVRLEVVLKDPTEEGCVEFSYPELLLCREARVRDLPFPPFFLLPPSASSTVALSAASSCRGVCPDAETAFGGGEGFALSGRAPCIPSVFPLPAWVAVCLLCSLGLGGFCGRGWSCPVLGCCLWGSLQVKQLLARLCCQSWGAVG